MDDGVYNKEILIQNAGGQVESWVILWEDMSHPSRIYTYVAYIFWKTVEGKYGYDYLYYYAYRDDVMLNTYGPFSSLEEMQRDYETESGCDMPFPTLSFT